MSLPCGEFYSRGGGGGLERGKERMRRKWRDEGLRQGAYERRGGKLKLIITSKSCIQTGEEDQGKITWELEKDMSPYYRETDSSLL